ncbi:MAG TPA: GNAT family N-acetyltransferase [Cellulomonas sp.]
MDVRRGAVLDARHTGALVLGEPHVERVLAMCAADPVGTVLASVRLEHAAAAGLRAAGGEVWGYTEGGELLAACWVGANLVPIIPPLDPGSRRRALDALADLGATRGRRCSSIVGTREDVLDLWDRLRTAWPPARDVRPEQPSMVIETPPRVVPDPAVRRSRPEEIETVLPACIAMFTEEVGYSPVGSGGYYEARVRSLIAQGRSFVRIEDGRVVFKAEVAAVALGVGQVQGVWVAPDRRGERLSEAGMAAVVEATRAQIAPTVSLYANDFNTRALAAYRAVGFRQVGTYATVLF